MSGSIVIPAGPLTRVYRSGSWSGSAARMSYRYGVVDSPAVTGALTIRGACPPAPGPTVIVNVWVATPPRPSDAAIVTAFGPAWAAVGAQVTTPVAESTVSPPGPLSTEYVTGSPSGSAAVTW